MILNIYDFSDGNKVYFFDDKNEHVLVGPEVKFNCDADNIDDIYNISKHITEIRIKRLKIGYNEWLKTLKVNK